MKNHLADYNRIQFINGGKGTDTVTLEVKHAEPMKFVKSTSHISSSKGIKTTVSFKESESYHTHMMKGLSSSEWLRHRVAKDLHKGIY